MEFNTISVTGVLTLELLLVFLSNCLAYPTKLTDFDFNAMGRLREPVSKFTNRQRLGTSDHLIESVSNLFYDLNEINMKSERTMFSESLPDMPPRALRTYEYSSNSNLNYNSSVHSRTKRSSSEKLSVCDHDTRWARKSWALTYLGINVTVLENIKTYGGGRSTQYFYETKCSEKSTTKYGCRGIDTAYWSSECITKETFVYAIVRNPKGQEGWNWIAINSSCDCALRQLPEESQIRHHRKRCRGVSPRRSKHRQ